MKEFMSPDKEKEYVDNKTCICFPPCREKRIDQDARTKPGSSVQEVWIEISNPTENDKGKYTLEMFDGKETHKRYLDLSGQSGWSVKDLKVQIWRRFQRRC